MSVDWLISEQKNLDRKNLVQEAYIYLTEGIFPAAATSNEKRVIRKNLRNVLCITANYSTREQTETVVALR